MMSAAFEANVAQVMNVIGEFQRPIGGSRGRHHRHRRHVSEERRTMMRGRREKSLCMLYASGALVLLNGYIFQLEAK